MSENSNEAAEPPAHGSANERPAASGDGHNATEPPVHGSTVAGQGSSSSRQLPPRIRALVQGVFAPVAILGAGTVGYLVIHFGSQSGRVEERAFAETQEFDIWSLLIAALFALNMTVLLVVLPEVQKLKKERSWGSLWPVMVVYGLIACAIVIVPPLVGGMPDVPVHWFRARLAIVYVVMFGLALFPAVGIGLIRMHLTAWSGKEGKGARLETLERYRTALQRLLVGFALIISGVVSAAGGLRNALLADPATGFNENNFPLKAVYLYAALFTGLLAISYVPTFLSWRDRTLETIRSIYEIPRNGRIDEDWHDGRTQLERLMRVNTTLGSTLTTALGILGPIVSSLITTYAGKL